MKKAYFVLVSVFVFFASTLSFGQAIIFFDDFDSYVAGQQLACQNPVDWTTWTCTPCAADDALISNAQSYSGSNSFVIVQGNDLVKEIGAFTSGKYKISFRGYIPTGRAGYFNTLSDFNCNTGGYWAMEVYFDAGGNARLLVDGQINFNWVADQWFLVEIEVDLDTDAASMWIDGGLIHSWTWTLGASGGVGPLVLDANDFYGPTQTATDEMYFDDYTVYDLIIPVELTSFTADVNNAGNVVLNWTTATETNNHMFEVQRQSANTEYRTVGFVNGAGTTTEIQEYSYVDQTVGTGTYTYRLKQIDFDGRYEYSPEVEIDVKGPLNFALEQNYPNPFNPSTKINYSVPETGNVKLAVYNLVGEEVAVLVNGTVEAGFYEVTFNASNLPSGAYFYKLQSDKTFEVKKMLLTK